MAKNSFVVEVTFKLESTYTLKPNENGGLENICKELEHSKTSLFRTKDNLYTLIKELDSLIRKIENKEIIIKPAEKGSIIVITRQIGIRTYVSPIFQINHMTEC